MMKTNNFIFILIFFFISCGSSDNYVPKPHGFPRLEMPVKSYRLFDTAELPYKFEIPVYCKMEKDTISNLTANKTWYNLNFKPFNATLHLTYYKFNNWNFFDSLVYDTRKLVNKHIQRADDILEENIETPNKNVKGILFNIEGNTATNLNFYLTDSNRHFLRGALYFNRPTSQDSIAPVFAWMKMDIQNLIQTFSWK